MRRLFPVLLLAASTAAAAAPKTPVRLGDLPAGLYRISVSGMLCKVCERAVTEEFKSRKEIESVSVDFEKGEILLTVKKGQILAASAFRKSLNRASTRINLGNRLEVSGAVYSPS